jgi:hypothetical protein
MAYIEIEMCGGGSGKTSAENSAALAKAVAALPAGGEIRFCAPNGTYKLDASTAPLTQANITLTGSPSCTLQWPTLGANKIGLDVAASGFSCSNVNFSGPGGEATYVAGETLLRVQGVSSANRLKGLTLLNCYFEKSGSYGLSAKWVDEVVLEDTDAANIAYAAFIFTSCNRGRVRGGAINVLGAIGTSSNAYGFSLSHDSTNYDTDPQRGTPLAANPFCSDWIVDGLTVIGPKIWQAIDTHGCYNTTFANCRTFAAKHGISVTGGSGMAESYAGWNNACINCVVDARMQNGTAAAGLIAGIGITLNGGAAVQNTGLICSNNRVHGYGMAVAGNYTGYAIYASVYADKFLISNNIITGWSGCGIFCQTGTTDGLVIDNVFGEPVISSPFVAECINVTGGATFRLRIGGNLVERGVTLQPTIGVRFGVASASRILVDPNMFDLCGIPYLNGDGVAHGPGLPGMVRISAVSGVVAIDCSLAKLAPAIPLTVVFSALTANITGVTLNNSVVGGKILLLNEDATKTVTFAASPIAALAGAASWVGTQWDTLTLNTRSASNPAFVEISRSANA